MRRILVRILFGFMLSLGGTAGGAQPAPEPDESAERSRLLDELRGVYRTLYAMSEDEQRGKILESLIDHDVAAMRAFGLDLTRRTLLNARDVPAEVLSQGETLLFDDSSAVRMHAAKLLATRGGEGASSALRRALAEETDPSAAREILRALSENPGDLRISALFKWMARGSKARESAFAVANAILRARGDRVPAHARDRLAELIGGFDAENTTLSRVELAWALGMEAFVDAALRSNDPELRTVAAELMSSDPAHVDAIIEIAREDPRVYPIAVEAIARHRPTAEGYETASRLPTSTGEQRREGLRRVRIALPPDELVSVARSESDLHVREEMLRHIEGESFAERLREARGGARALGELIVTRTKLDDCAGVIRAGGALERVGAEEMESRVLFCLVRCNVAMGRVDEARNLTEQWLDSRGVTAERLAGSWLEGIGRLAETDGPVERAGEALRALLGDSMTSEQLAVLSSYVSAPEAADASEETDAEVPGGDQEGDGTIPGL